MLPILVEKFGFDDLFHKKGLVLVIRVPGMIKLSGSVDFFDEMRLSRSLRLLRPLRPLRLQKS